MQEFNVEIGSKLILIDLIYRVEAENKIQAIKKVRELGFNCGKQLSSSWKGEFIAKNIIEIRKK